MVDSIEDNDVPVISVLIIVVLLFGASEDQVSFLEFGHRVNRAFVLLPVAINVLDKWPCVVLVHEFQTVDQQVITGVARLYVEDHRRLVVQTLLPMRLFPRCLSPDVVLVLIITAAF